MPLETQLMGMLSSVPDWLATVVLGALPISELRGAIPFAIYNGISPVYAYFLAVLGNMIPVIPLLLFLEPVSRHLRRYRIFDKFFSWLFERTRHNHSESFERYGTLALIIFVAIPLPATGAWSGCAAAFVFGIKFRHAFPAILAGVIIAGIIVSILTITGISLFDLLMPH